ncbi:MAG: MFS transporter [Halieaceae bacterium]|nr:MFS transporter [Halieaceae bacterium]
MNSLLHHRYTQLAVLILAGGTIYPLLYLRQNFELSLLETYQLSSTDLGQLYSLLGVIFVATYLPSGWLADRFSTRGLVAVSLAATGLLGLWFASVPGLWATRVIFIGWGLATGLTFWAALIKSVSLIAPHDKQAGYFGWLDGGRGLVEALLATIAVALFAHTTENLQADTATAMRQVVLFYALIVLSVSPLALAVLRIPGDSAQPSYAEKTGAPPATAHATLAAAPQPTPATSDAAAAAEPSLPAALKPLLRNPRLWLAAFCIFAGYQLFWATYALSAYLQQELAMTAVAAGGITVAKLWMRPIGAIGAGLLGDRIQAMPTLAGLLILGALTLCLMAWLPSGIGETLLVALVLMLGLASYGARGIYWASLDDCNIPAHGRGLAIGLMSLVGYLPDIFSPLTQGLLLNEEMGREGYRWYFGLTAAIALCGAGAALWLQRLVHTRELWANAGSAGYN